MVSASPKLDSALNVLKKAATKGKTKKSVLDAINGVSSALIFLKSESVSPQTFSKLIALLRHPFIPLYASYPDQALTLAGFILKHIIDNHLTAILQKTNENSSADTVQSKEGWEKAVYSLLSGILDHLENDDSDQTKGLISGRFYKTICAFFFDLNTTNSINVGSQARCIAYSVLSDTCAMNGDNQSKLRDSRLLGPKKLGIMISRSKEFVPLESLLTLFARILPSSATPDKRVAFIQATFLTTKAFSNGDNIAKLLKDVSAKDWEVTATKIVDELAAADKSYPQPFDLDEIAVCGHVFPQPELSDRLYLDQNSILANVLQEDGLYETLLINYKTVKSIRLMEDSSKRKTQITIDLASSPSLSDQPLKFSQDNEATSPRFVVEIADDEVLRFIEVSKHRGLDHALFEDSDIEVFKSQRISVASTCFELDLDKGAEDALDSSLQKSKVVEKFYNDGSDDAPASCATFEAPKFKEANIQSIKEMMGESKVKNIVKSKAPESVSKPRSVAHSKVKQGADRPENEADIWDEFDLPVDDHASNVPTKVAQMGVEKKVMKKAVAKDKNGSDKRKVLNNAKKVVTAAAPSKVCENPRLAANSPPPSEATTKTKDRKEMGSKLKKVQTTDEPAVERKSRRAAAITASSKLAAAAQEDSAGSTIDDLNSDFEADIEPKDDVETKDTPNIVNANTVLDNEGGETDTKRAPVSKSTGISDAIAKMSVKHAVEAKPRDSNVAKDNKPSDSTRQHAMGTSAFEKPVSTKAAKPKPKPTVPPAESEKTLPRQKRKRDDETTETNDKEDKSAPRSKKKKVASETELPPAKRKDSSALTSRNKVALQSTQKYGGRPKKALTETLGSSDKENKAIVEETDVPKTELNADFDEIPKAAPRPKKPRLAAIDDDEFDKSSDVLAEKSSSPLFEKRVVKNDHKSHKEAVADKTEKIEHGRPREDDRQNDEDVSSKIEQMKKRRIRDDKEQDDEYVLLEKKKSRKSELMNRIMEELMDIDGNKTPEIVDSPLTRSEDVFDEDATMIETFKAKADFALYKVGKQTIGLDDAMAIDEWNDSIRSSSPVNEDAKSESKYFAKPGKMPSKIAESRPLSTPSSKKNSKMLSYPIVDKKLKESSRAIRESTPVSKSKLPKKGKPEFVDLTLDDEPTFVENAVSDATRRLLKNNNTKIESRLKNIVEYDDLKIISSPVTPSRPTVTFDPVLRYKQLSIDPDDAPDYVQVQAGVKRTPTGRSVSGVSHKEDASDKYTDAEDMSSKRRKMKTITLQKNKTPRKADKERKEEPEMAEIVDIINAITDNVVQNIGKKSEAVKHSIRVSRDRLLRDAIIEFDAMKQESVKSYNTLLDLETEYARFNRNMLVAQEDLNRINKEMLSMIQESVKNHDRNMLSKKMPRSILPAMPAAFKIKI